MQVLIIKTSSMGDVIHTLPAVTDAVNAIGNIKFDWVVEPAFQEIPRWHSAVAETIVVPLRKWRRNLFQSLCSGEITRFFTKLREKKYDAVIDAQGLLKSAILARISKSTEYYGLHADSARENLASLFYTKTATVAQDLHAMVRLRQLFAASLNYDLTNARLDYGVNWQQFQNLQAERPYLFFLHGTTWDTKHWPEAHWQKLAAIVGRAGYDVYVTWATAEQKARAARLSANGDNVKMLPHLSINEAVMYLKSASGVVAVDTGFGHLASALQRPLVSLFGPTDPNKVGVFGDNQFNLSSVCNAGFAKKCPCINKSATFPACLAALTPEIVWEKLKLALKLC